MSFLERIAVLILTYNEAPNIGRTLAALHRLPEVVVLDSNSTDETADIVSQFANARLVRRAFDNHESQWTYGLASCRIEREWVLALDADYVLPDAAIAEIAALEPDATVAGYRVGFNYCIEGRRLSASLYPPVVALYRRHGARYEQAGHTQRVVVSGRVLALANRIDHDDRKPLSRWFASQQKYAALEVDYLLARSPSELRRSDRVRLAGWPAPPLVFIYTLLWKRCLLDGWPGWFYVLQRTLAEILIALELADRRLRKSR